MRVDPCPQPLLSCLKQRTQPSPEHSCLDWGWPTSSHRRNLQGELSQSNPFLAILKWETETPIRGHQSPVQEHIDSRVQSWDAKDVWWGKQRSAAEVTEVVRLSRSGLTFGLPGYSSQDACLYCYCCCSVAHSYLTLCNPMDCSTPGFLVLHCLPEVAQTHVHWVSDAIQPSRPLLPPSLPSLSLSQHQGLFQWVSFSHQGAKILELQLQHQSFQWIFRVDWFDLLAV